MKHKSTKKSHDNLDTQFVVFLNDKLVDAIMVHKCFSLNCLSIVFYETTRYMKNCIWMSFVALDIDINNELVNTLMCLNFFELIAKGMV